MSGPRDWPEGWSRDSAARTGTAAGDAERTQVIPPVDGRSDRRTPEEKQRDLDRAVRELRPQILPMLTRGTRRLVFRARMFIWKQRYRLTDLSIINGKVRATINPTSDMFDVEEKLVGAPGK